MKHLLYAEDREDDVFFLDRACRRAGLHDRLAIHAVRDGQLAVDYLRGTGGFADRQAHPLPDLVLLDLKMPNRSGLEVLEWIRRDNAFTGLPVYLLTSSNQQSDIQRASALGATGYRTKPSDISELARLVRELARAIGIDVSEEGPTSKTSRSSGQTG